MSQVRLSAQDILAIGAGGILGSLLRYAVGQGFEGAFPVPTLLVNWLGAAALALLHATQHRLHPGGRYLYMVGFCGSFTTVSLFSLETVDLLQQGHVAWALAYVGLSIGPALALVSWIVLHSDRLPGKGARA